MGKPSSSAPPSAPLPAPPQGGAPLGADDFPEVPDEELVERVLQGEPAWFELLMRRYNQRLFRVTRAILGNAAEAEDVTQDAYVRAYTHLGQFEGRARFATWLTKIAVYEARERARKGRRFTPLEELQGVTDIRRPTLLRTAPGDDPESSAAARELGAVLQDAVDELPENLREVFILRQVEGLSTAEAAECLDISSANVKVRLHRARTVLQSEVDRRLGEAARSLWGFDGERCDRLVRRVLERISHLDAPASAK